VNQLGKSIARQASSKKPSSSEEPKQKNPAAVELGRPGGKVGGPARARQLSAKKRQEIARKAAEARWSKSKTEYQ